MGLREPGVWALLTVLTTPCYIAVFGQPLQCIEITRIQCDEHVRGTGLFVKFVAKLAISCKRMDRCLVMGCVECDKRKDARADASTQLKSGAGSRRTRHHTCICQATTAAATRHLGAVAEAGWLHWNGDHAIRQHDTDAMAVILNEDAAC